MTDDGIEDQRREVTYLRSHSKFTACRVVLWKVCASTLIKKKKGLERLSN